MRMAITRPRTIRARKIQAASKTLSRSVVLRFIDFSTRPQTTNHNGSANNAKEKSECLQETRRATPPYYDIRAAGFPHFARSGSGDVCDLCASDRASVHHSG